MQGITGWLLDVDGIGIGVLRQGIVLRLLIDRIGRDAILLNAYRKLGQRLRFLSGHVGAEAVGYRQDQTDADDAKGGGDGRYGGPSLLGHHVLEGHLEGSPERHPGLLDVFGFGNGNLRGQGLQHLLIGNAGGGFLYLLLVGLVGLHYSILHGNDAVGIGKGQFPVMGDHYHQLGLRQGRKDIHHLNRGLAIQGTGRLVGQDYGWIVYYGSRYCHSLLLATRQLVRMLTGLVGQTHGRQGLLGLFPYLLLWLISQGKRDGGILEDVQMGNQVIALEDHPDFLVAIIVPVTILVSLGRDTVHDQIAGSVPVEARDYVQQGGLATTGGTQNSYQATFAKRKADALQGMDTPGFIQRVVFLNIYKFEHGIPLSHYLTNGKNHC